MSEASARAAMRQLVTIERDANASTDSSNWSTAEQTPDWQQHLADVPCCVWVGAGREAADATSIIVVEDMRAGVPLGTDVTARDRLGDITDSSGNTVVSGPVGIRAVLNQRDYLELVLVQLS